MIKLKKIEVEGFRAYREGMSLDLDKHLIVFSGNIGSGKTSLLMAIEFALFGTTRDVKKKILKKEDLVNDFSNEARVFLEIDNEGKIVKIERKIRKNKRSKCKVIFDNNELYDELADQFLENILGISLEDYSKQIAVTHFDLQELIYGSPANRSVTIDRLLGIDFIENIFRSIQLGNIEIYDRKISDNIRNLEYKLRILEQETVSDEEIESLNNELYRLKEKESELEELHSELIQEYKKLQEKEREYKLLKEKEVRLVSFLDHYKQVLKSLGKEDVSYLIYERIRHGLTRILEELLLEKDKDEIASYPLSKDNVSDFVQICKKKIETIEDERDKLEKELNELTIEREYRLRKIQNLERELGRLSLLNEEYESYQEKLSELIEKYGEEENIRRKINGLKIKIEKEKTRIAEGRCILLIQKKLLEEENNKKIICPVCGFSNVLKEEVKKLYEKNVKEYSITYREDIEELEFEKNRLEEILNEIKSLKDKIIMNSEIKVKFEELEQRYNDFSDELRELEENINMLEEKIERVSVLLKNINRLIAKVETIQKIEDMRRKINEYEKKLSELRSKLDKIGFDDAYFRKVYEKYMETKSQIETVKMKIEILEEKQLLYKENKELRDKLSKELALLKKKKKKTDDLKHRLVKVKNVFRFLQSELRKEMLERINNSMNDIFKKIYIFEDYDAIELRLRTATGIYKRSIYELYTHRKSDDSWVLVSNRLSDGQKIIVALCLVVALSRLYNHNVGFLILDEPIPNVDDNIRETVYRVLGKELNIEQILIATQHAESFEKLDDEKIFLFEKIGDDIRVIEK